MTFLLQLSDCSRIAGETVPGKDVHGPIVRICHRALEEYLSGLSISGFRQIEVHRLAHAVDRAEQVHPSAGDANERFIDVPSQ